MESGELGAYMVSLCLFATLLQHSASPIRQIVTGEAYRRALMGLAMGGTVVAIILSPWGRQSGGHFNPAITFTFYRLRKVNGWDVVFYAAGHFSGAIAGVALGRWLLRGAPGEEAVRYAVTVPGPHGSAAAFAGEFTLSLILMITILYVSNHRRLRRHTPYIAGALVAVYIAIEAPLSGMSTNPARTAASGFFAHYWRALWIYFTAPPLGMLAAAELFVRARGGVGPCCAKLHHTNDTRCIFHCGYQLERDP